MSKQLVSSNSVASSALVCAPGQVEGHKVHMLMDTGSGVTLIHRHLLDKFTQLCQAIGNHWTC